MALIVTLNTDRKQKLRFDPRQLADAYNVAQKYRELDTRVQSLWGSMRDFVLQAGIEGPEFFQDFMLQVQKDAFGESGIPELWTQHKSRIKSALELQIPLVNASLGWLKGEIQDRRKSLKAQELLAEAKKAGVSPEELKERQAVQIGSSKVWLDSEIQDFLRVLATLSEEDQAQVLDIAKSAALEAAGVEPQEAAPVKDSPVIASPAAHALLQEHQLNGRDVPGTGADGRITKQDVLDYLDSITASAEAS